ncbi:unnamed protein product [Rotaria socialis]|uniref:Uncharacterized protein n=2 Tax=Rotaria socialis TaxID=392032 RepID=A0A818R4B7_9BILA|nr:unnamed protein product [Rotaria socialis]CAF3651560.1 unnamed protein product [Rotaria socialis]CAF4245394.1 unnamed protein product [Rotaria socialis]CAF4549086.1 unnamed protein product [Rotaria socialis]
MKIIAILFLCYFININFINANYPSHQCYVCDKSSCDHPTAEDIKQCSLDETGGTSGKYFVAGAFTKNNTNNIYNDIEEDLNSFGTGPLGLNESSMPSWNSLTRWVCFVSKDHHRGCLLMGKGLCSESKSLLGRMKGLAKKLTSIVKKAKEVVNKMFTDPTVAAKLDIAHQLNITNWFEENYMSKLVSNFKEPQYQLEICCEGNKCNNYASMVQISTAILILSILILI